MVRRFVEDHDFKLALNYHTWGNLLIYPWGYAGGIQTPDSGLFQAYAKLITIQNGYKYGTSDETVLYAANGTSDDWMYGEQGTKPKIFSMTPETGSDGFWPDSSEIVPNSNDCLFQNITMAALLGKYARVEAISGSSYINAGSAYLSFRITQLGLDTAGPYTVSLTSLNPQVLVNTPSFIYPSLSLLQSKVDSFACTIPSSLQKGQEIKWVIKIDNGSYTISDTLTKFFYSPDTMFVDQGNSINAWSGGDWNTTSEYFVSPPTSITDSPNGLYQAQNDNETVLSQGIDLRFTLQPRLIFKAKWSIETDYDFAQILVSGDSGSSWTVLCGRYSTTGTANQDVGQPVYEGVQDEWVTEDISLSPWQGKRVLLKLKLQSDPVAEQDGFYLDDLLVVGYDTGTLSVMKNPEFEQPTLLSCAPNPATRHTEVSYRILAGDATASLSLADATGRVLKQWDLARGSSQIQINTTGFAPGVYVCFLSSGGRRSLPYKLVVE
jgi:hypothetical protein